MQVVVGIFQNGPDAECAGLLPVRELCKEVSVPLTAHIRVFVRQSAHHTAGQSALRHIIIGVHLQRTGKGCSLNTKLVDVAVAAYARSIFILGMIAEGIVAVAVGVLCVDKAEPFVAPRGRSTMCIERACAVRGRKRRAVGTVSIQVNG